LRVAIMQKVAAAQTRVNAAETVNRALTDRNSQRAKDLAAAQRRVSQAVRESYINGMDTELLSSSLLLMSGPNVDPTVAMALERAIRSQDNGLNSALAALEAAAKDLADNEHELGAARSELTSAQAESSELDKR